jgi:uncharacterized sporulation protein YeaH/YhbH (DUF444 family)
MGAGTPVAMTALSAFEPFFDAGCSDSVEDSDADEVARPSREEPADPAVGKGCAEALVKRGLIGASHQSYAAALITHVNNDAIAATRELLRQAMIEKHNEAVVAEFIKRTVRRRAWGVERPVAVGRLAQNLHQRRAAAALESRRHREGDNR